MSRKHVFTVAALLAFAAVVVLGYQRRVPKSVQEDKNVAAVRAVIESQAAAWNRGDIEGYMDGYAKEDSTEFVSGDSLTRGWQTVLDRYKAHYDSRAKMGTLTFSELEIKPLSEYYIMATGRWQLARDADTPHGRFTLIFRRTAAGWRIVHDHTSSA
ncbi:MAG TPA: nuclear transport factor 2 family protein [Pyrinomonadaceae bacterium]|jgi:ketosteroid isomerase-like protein|nr:nuclear transport factor 2 family protein [Pyrinomonadaceae bacterium]